MCIAILKTKNGIITDEALRNSFEANPDGAGIAYTVKGEVIIEKGIFKVNKFISKVRKAEKVCDGNMLIHCRIGTSGGINKLNCHPFLVHDDLAMIHNGVLDIQVPMNSKINDTQIYINEYLKGFTTDDLIRNKNLQKLIEYSIGRNKFVFLSSKNEYAIINESAGHWVDGVWYSNTSYQTVQYYPNWYYEEQEVITPKEKDTLKNTITNLSAEQILEIGDYPYIDTIGSLDKLYNVNDFEFGDEYYIPLEEVSSELYDLYIEMCDTVDEMYRSDINIA